MFVFFFVCAEQGVPKIKQSGMEEKEGNQQNEIKAWWRILKKKKKKEIKEEKGEAEVNQIMC